MMPPDDTPTWAPLTPAILRELAAEARTLRDGHVPAISWANAAIRFEEAANALDRLTTLEIRLQNIRQCVDLLKRTVA